MFDASSLRKLKLPAIVALALLIAVSGYYLLLAIRRTTYLTDQQYPAPDDHRPSVRRLGAAPGGDLPARDRLQRPGRDDEGVEVVRDVEVRETAAAEGCPSAGARAAHAAHGRERQVVAGAEFPIGRPAIRSANRPVRRADLRVASEGHLRHRSPGLARRQDPEAVRPGGSLPGRPRFARDAGRFRAEGGPDRGRQGPRREGLQTVPAAVLRPAPRPHGGRQPAGRGEDRARSGRRAQADRGAGDGQDSQRPAPKTAVQRPARRRSPPARPAAGWSCAAWFKPGLSPGGGSRSPLPPCSSSPAFC